MSSATPESYGPYYNPTTVFAGSGPVVAGMPHIFGASPVIGYAGAVVTLTGTNFSAVTVVRASLTEPSSDGRSSVVESYTVTPVVSSATSLTFVFPDSPATRIKTPGTTFQLTAEAPSGSLIVVSPPFNYTIGPVPGYSLESLYAAPQRFGYGFYTGEPTPGLAVHRWVFTDPYAGDSYTVPRNPAQMTSPFPKKSINLKTTTAVDGQVIAFEGAPTPVEWTFSGETVDAAHYDVLRSWVYDRNRRIIITDHFGRQLTVVLTEFKAAPKRAVGKYWRHTYDISALVFAISPPTVVPVAPVAGVGAGYGDGPYGTNPYGV